MEEYSQNAASLLIEEIEAQKILLINVATGGSRIEDVNSEYLDRRKEIRRKLTNLEIEDPNPFEDLWAWYAEWKSKKLETYISRRQYIREMYSPLLNILENIERGAYLEDQSKSIGWERVHRGFYKMRTQLETSSAEEDFQRVGLLGREVIISLAQTVYNPNLHTPIDGVIPSNTDAKRMLEAFIAKELSGKGNEELRAQVKASLKLAVNLQHKRTADYRIAAICFEATRSLINIISLVSNGDAKR